MNSLVNTYPKTIILAARKSLNISNIVSKKDASIVPSSLLTSIWQIVFFWNSLDLLSTQKHLYADAAVGFELVSTYCDHIFHSYQCAIEMVIDNWLFCRNGRFLLPSRVWSRSVLLHPVLSQICTQSPLVEQGAASHSTKPYLASGTNTKCRTVPNTPIVLSSLRLAMLVWPVLSSS